MRTLLVTAQIEGGESNVTDGELLRCYQTQLASRHKRINRIIPRVLTGMESRLKNSNSVILTSHIVSIQSQSSQGSRIFPCVGSLRSQPIHQTKPRHPSIPSTCATASSFQHCQDPRKATWRACSAVPNWTAHRRLFHSTCQPIKISPHRSSAKEKKHTPVDDPHDLC